MKKYVLLAVLLYVVMGNIYAQNRREPVVFTILAGVPLPISGFGSTNTGQSGFAGPGGGGTFEFAALVYSPGIAWVTSFSYFYNPVKENEFKNALVGENISGFSSGSWNNVNLLTGLKIYGPFLGSQLIFAFQAGVNFASPPDITLPANITDISFSYGNKTSFAYSLGAGFNFSGFLIGARYMQLGEPELKAANLSAGGAALTVSKMPVKTVFIYIGFNL